MVEADQEPDSIELLAADARKTRRTRALVGGGALLVALVGGGYGLTQLGPNYDDVVVPAWSNLSACLLGAPLDKDENAALRMRAVELGQMAAPVGDAGPWPARCAPFAHGLAHAVDDVRRDGTEPLSKAATTLATQLEKKPPLTEAIPAIEALYAQAASLSLVANPAEEEVPQPAAPVTSLNADTLPASARVAGEVFHPSHMQREPFPAGDPRFLIDEEGLPGGPRLCSYQPQSKELSCRAIPAPAADKSPRLQLWGTTEPGAEAMVFAGDRGREGIFRSSDGVRIGKTLVYGATAQKSGALRLTIWNKKRGHLSLAVAEEGKKLRAKKLVDYEDSGNPYYTTGLFWDWFVHKGWDKKGHLELYARRVSDDFGDWGEVLDLGPIVEPGIILRGENPPHLEACRHGEMMAVRARGKRNDRITFYTGGKWSKLVMSRGVGGTLTCVEGAVLKTHPFEGDVVHNHCTPQGCKAHMFSLRKAIKSHAPGINKDESIVTAPLGDNVAVVYKSGDRGALRLVMGPADSPQKATERVIYDDMVRDKKLSISTLLSAGLYAGTDYALLILSTVTGNYAFHLAIDGTLTPVKATTAAP